MHLRVQALNKLHAIERGRRDTAFFATYWLGLDLNPFQVRLFEVIDQGDYSKLMEVVVDCGNRSGKTVALAIIHIKFAFYKIGITAGEGFEDFGYRTFDMSPVSRQAKECLLYIEQILTGMFSWEVGGVRKSNRDRLRLRNFFEARNENLGEIRFSNHSKAYAISTGHDQAAGVQGLSGGLITYDECVQGHHLRTELDGNIYPRLGDYGKLFMLVATPSEEAPSQQFYYHLVREAKRGKNGVKFVDGKYTENIFIPEAQRKDFVERLMAKNPEKAKQVLDGAFVVTGGTMLEPEVIEQMWKGEKPTYPIDGNTYVIAGDWGVSDQGDETVFLVFDVTELEEHVPNGKARIVNAFAKQGGDPWELMSTYERIVTDYNQATNIMDTASLGGTLLKKMLAKLKPIAFNAHVNSGRVKQEALTYMQLAMTRDRRLVRIGDTITESNPDFGIVRSYYLPMLEEQLSSYKADDSKLKQDWVSAFYIGLWYIYRRYFKVAEKQSSYKLHLFRSTALEEAKGLGHKDYVRP